MPGLRAYWLGRVGYRTCWDLQRSLVDAVREGRQPDTFLLLEHPHVFTMGRRGHADHLIWSEAECARRGVEVVWSDRGGDATYHGPGQLVGYGILDLARLGVDILEYVHGLETSLIGYLRTLGLTSEAGGPGLTGVWSHNGGPQGPLEKVAAIGCKLNQSITSHGFALNLTTDLEIFNEGIVPCGLSGKRATSVQALGGPPLGVEHAGRAYLPFLTRTLGLEPAWGEASELEGLPPPVPEPAVGPRLQVL
ncbi:MAG TPA: lipoyl(octanoyl) transferase LipB [Candidatus Binatia bacterium]|nr:lipoyl(octanoyl) transferase LipB [Candidatus Binatia bacterium]